MQRRSLIIIAIVALLAVTGVTVGLVATRAQGEPQLATITPAQLLANVAQHAGDITAVSGDVSWKNDVLGLSMLSFGGQGSGDLTALLSSGSGRVWVQDGKARFEIQGAMGDTTVVGDSTSVWVYTSASHTATEYTLPAGSKATQGDEQSSATPSSQKAVADPVAAIDDFIQKLAPDATLAVSDQVTVAGQSCYVLSLIPKATNTIFGSVQVAIDSETYLPLKLDVYAKGTVKPVFTAGFTSVSYSELSDSIFAFTPPSTATVEHKALTLPAGMASRLGAGSAVEPDSATDHSSSNDEKAPLTLAEAAAKAGFTPPSAQTTDPALTFGGASVIPAQEVDLQSLLGQLQSGALGSIMPGFGALGSDPDAQSSTSSTVDPSQSLPTSLMSGPVTVGPTVIQRYGQGFGTVVLVEAKVPTELTAQLEQMLSSVPLLSRTTAGGATIYQLNTALGSVALWDKDGLLFMAAGSVSQTDLTGFIASVR
ncbi:MAG: outer membrane lipoprotein carrier protein LolA [bacterium]